MRSGQELEGGLLQIAALYSSTEISCHVEVDDVAPFHHPLPHNLL